MPKKQKKSTKHEYTTTSLELEKVVFRVSNFIVLFAIFFVDGTWDVQIPETVYIILIGAILGVDIPSLTRRFLRKL